MRLWPVGGWVSLIWGNLAQSAWSVGSGWVGGWLGGWVFTERTVVKSDKIFRSQAIGIEPTLFQADGAVIYH